jgi:hypothetical protein
VFCENVGLSPYPSCRAPQGPQGPSILFSLHLRRSGAHKQLDRGCYLQIREQKSLMLQYLHGHLATWNLKHIGLEFSAAENTVRVLTVVIAKPITLINVARIFYYTLC